MALVPLLAACSTQASPGVGSGERGGDASTRASPSSAPRPLPAVPLPDGVEFEQTVWTLDDGSPVRISVLTVAHDAAVDIEGAHGSAVASTDTVRDLAREANAVAAVNGTFFDAEATAYDGDPLGLYGTRGTLLSEAANGRTALILPGPGERPRIAELSSTTHVVASDGTRHVVDGTNRVPGRILGCGGVGGDRHNDTREPATLPSHGRLCVDPDEIVAFPAQWGSSSPPGKEGSFEAVLDGSGAVTGVRSPAGGSIPDGGRTLVGIGEGAAWLHQHARRGEKLTVSSGLVESDGTRVRGSAVSVFGAGPALVRSGRVWINARANGVSDGAVRTRSPRTVVGIRADGTTVLAVFDGRRPGVSEGVTLPEAARYLVTLGAVEAMNLDGGGSSTMVAQDRVRNSPSDPGRSDEDRQREVSNAIVVVPRT